MRKLATTDFLFSDNNYGEKLIKKLRPQPAPADADAEGPLC